MCELKMLKSYTASVTYTYHRWGLEAEPPAAGGYLGLGAKLPAAQRFFVICLKKKAILMPLDYILLVFRAICKN